MQEHTVQTCRQCGRQFPHTREFFRVRRGKVTKQCKPCARNEAAAFRAADPERQREYNRKQREATKADPERHEAGKLTRRRWYQRNPAPILAQCAKYRAANAEKIAERDRRYRQSERGRATRSKPEAKAKRALRWQTYAQTLGEQERAQRAETLRQWRLKNVEHRKAYRRAYRLANPELIRKLKRDRRARILNAEGTFTEADVKLKLKQQQGRCHWCGKKLGAAYHVDHIIALARGGTNWPSNICCACPDCNLSKSAKMPWEFAGRLF